MLPTTDPNPIAAFAPYIFWIGSTAALIASSLSTFRALTLCKDPISSRIAAGVITAICTFFFLVLWFSCTILDPKTDHFSKCFQAWVLLGPLPSLLITLKAGRINPSGQATNPDEEKTKP